MSNHEVEVLIVGAGQAGISMSEHLSLQGVPHLVVERDRIAERWRTGRWDSLVANGPAWHDRFPGQEFNISPDAFATKDQVAAKARQLLAAPKARGAIGGFFEQWTSTRRLSSTTIRDVPRAPRP